MFNPRPECTRYSDHTPKRDIYLADRALASTQNMNIQQMQHQEQQQQQQHTPQHQEFLNTTNLITSAPPTFTMGEQSHPLSHPTFIDRGGVNTRTLKSVNNQQTNSYYQMGRMGAEASTMMDLTRPMDTRLQYSDKRQKMDQNKRVPMSKAMPQKF